MGLDVCNIIGFVFSPGLCEFSQTKQQHSHHISDRRVQDKATGCFSFVCRRITLLVYRLGRIFYGVRGAQEGNLCSAVELEGSDV